VSAIEFFESFYKGEHILIAEEVKGRKVIGCSQCGNDCDCGNSDCNDCSDCG